MRPLFVLVLVLSSCSMPPVPPPPPDAPSGRPLGMRCTADGDCASGMCLPGTRICSAACSAATDCGGSTLVCGTAACETPGGCPRCVPACGAPNYTCVDGVSTDCSLAPDDSYCLDCGCAVASEHCVRGVGCRPPAPVGDPCVLDRDCASRNCSTYGNICRVAVGTTCTTENCDICLTLPTGGRTHCSRECRTAADCNGDACVGSTALLVFQCRPPACTTGSCTVSHALHEVGEYCRDDAQCRSGSCFSTERCVGSECIGEGWCSGPCTAQADCGPDTRCVVIPCASGQTTGCGNVCLHACEEFVDCGIYGGSCSQVMTPERTVARVCDVRREEGRACRDDRECISARCEGGNCSP